MKEVTAGLAVAFLGVTAPAMQRGDDAVSKTALVREDIVIPPAPVLTPAEELATFVLPEGFEVELVASEPLINDPVQIVFDEATADFDLGRDDQLMLATGGEFEAVSVDEINGYDGEVRHLLGAIANGTALEATVEEAADLAEMLEAEREALGAT